MGLGAVENSSPQGLMGSPFSAAPIAWMRVVTAFAVLAESVRIIAGGSVEKWFVGNATQFRYSWFDFLPGLTGLVPYVYFPILATLALALAFGWRTSIVAPLVSLLYGYQFLIVATAYHDHCYLILILSLLCCLTPVNRFGSCDRYSGRESESTIEPRHLWLIRAQFLIVLIYSGAGQWNRDWLAGAPITERGTLSTGTAMLLTWSTALLEPLLALGLLWRKTRKFALPLAGIYLLTDLCLGYFFQGGSFVSGWSPSPILLLALLPIWLEPKTFENWVPRIGDKTWFNSLSRTVQFIDRFFDWFDDTPVFGKEKAPPRSIIKRFHLPAALSTAFLIWQIALPLRGYFFTTSPGFTGYGTRFSWRGNRVDRLGRISFEAQIGERDERYPLDPEDDIPVELSILFTPGEFEKQNLSEGVLQDLVQATEETMESRISTSGLSIAEADRVIRSFESMSMLRLDRDEWKTISVQPDLVWQYSRHAAQVLTALTGERVSIYVTQEISINSRPFEPVFRELDLSSYPLAGAIPLESLNEPLPDRDARTEFVALRNEEERMRKEIDEEDSGQDVGGEPIKAPPISEEGEAWLTEHFPGG